MCADGTRAHTRVTMIGRLLLLSALVVSVEACSHPDGGETEGGAQMPLTPARDRISFDTALARARAAEEAARTQGIAPCVPPQCDSLAASATPKPDPEADYRDGYGDGNGYPPPAPGPAGIAVVPTVYVDSGTCPTGCWKGGDWTSLRRVELRERPDIASPVTAVLDSGTVAMKLRWEDHALPQAFVVKHAVSMEAHQGSEENIVKVSHAVGDTLWALKYTGEGHFTVMLKNGAVVHQSLGFSSGHGNPGSRCETSSHCWGVLSQELKMTYWSFLRTADGREGWTNQPHAFLVPD